MGVHTIVNLKEVEDQAPQFGVSSNMESRFATVPLKLENSGISYQRLAAGFRQPFGHRHSRDRRSYAWSWEKCQGIARRPRRKAEALGRGARAAPEGATD